ncbi:hypothetical protein PoB_001660600 [Plakobranchus ocellatus]|uniref:Uncharacterized protein n=1 Tax=Plakobranchus ocellatus TaxID=259542 RepID=A0AAV3Z679_9GAST|nr:hypothetical protein PoB_001660600 [Plakobranchus ocellatus]
MSRLYIATLLLVLTVTSQCPGSDALPRLTTRQLTRGHGYGRGYGKNKVSSTLKRKLLETGSSDAPVANINLFQCRFQSSIPGTMFLKQGKPLNAKAISNEDINISISSLQIWDQF